MPSLPKQPRPRDAKDFFHGCSSFSEWCFPIGAENRASGVCTSFKETALRRGDARHYAPHCWRVNWKLPCVLTRVPLFGTLFRNIQGKIFSRQASQFNVIIHTAAPRALGSSRSCGLGRETEPRQRTSCFEPQHQDYSRNRNQSGNNYFNKMRHPPPLPFMR